MSELTPTASELALRPGNFATLAEALDYASDGRSGLNFHDARGRLAEALPYSELRQRAQRLARRLMGLGLARGDRIAVVADTTTTFPVAFFACQYAGLVPVALPGALNLGGHDAYVGQIRGLLRACRAAVAIANDPFMPFLAEAAEGLPGTRLHTPKSLQSLPQGEGELHPTRPQETAYLQFTSGSTRFPRGVIIRQHAVMDNLHGIIRHGLAINEQDRCTSWLPFYHDMGMVGLLLGPLASQRSVDYLGTRDFAVRPLQWLRLLSRNGGTVSFAPPFGFDLANRRARDSDLEGLDLSAWRVAGVGAELIRPALLERFAQRFERCGFDHRAFRSCYGLAEASLAVTFAPSGRGLRVDRTDAKTMAESGHASTADEASTATRSLVACGGILPGYEIEIRDAHGDALPERRIGHIAIRGPSVMSGYYNDVSASEEALDPAGWLRTGDLGYLTEDQELVVTGRHKDLIIINGRNLWPEDLEQRVEQEREVRSGDASAFAVTTTEGLERVVLVLQCRLREAAAREDLRARVEGAIRSDFGVNPEVELVGPHDLPRTSSGKLSRAAARKAYLARHSPEPAARREPSAVVETAQTGS